MCSNTKRNNTHTRDPFCFLYLRSETAKFSVGPVAQEYTDSVQKAEVLKNSGVKEGEGEILTEKGRVMRTDTSERTFLHVSKHAARVLGACVLNVHRFSDVPHVRRSSFVSIALLSVILS